jgi:hypothetical protein
MTVWTLKGRLGNLNDDGKAPGDAGCSRNDGDAFASEARLRVVPTSEFDPRENRTHLWGVGRCEVKGPNGDNTGNSLFASTKTSVSEPRGYETRWLTLNQEQEWPAGAPQRVI